MPWHISVFSPLFLCLPLFSFLSFFVSTYPHTFTSPSSGMFPFTFTSSYRVFCFPLFQVFCFKMSTFSLNLEYQILPWFIVSSAHHILLFISAGPSPTSPRYHPHPFVSLPAGVCVPLPPEPWLSLTLALLSTLYILIFFPFFPVLRLTLFQQNTWCSEKNVHCMWCSEHTFIIAERIRRGPCPQRRQRSPL